MKSLSFLVDYMDKRGQSLPLNTLVIIILVVIVLIVIAVFFLGGTSSLSKSIRSIFFGATAGTDRSLAVEICNQRCEQAKNLPSNVLKMNSAYCRNGFDIDLDRDGKTESQEERDIRCWEPELLGSNGCILGKDSENKEVLCATNT